MRIAINCRSILLSQRTGIGRYTYHLIDSLGQIDQDNQYYLYAPKRLFDFKRRLPSFSYKNFYRQMDYFNQGSSRGEIYHLPTPGTIGVYKGKLIVTIHDLVYKTFPQTHTPDTIALTEKHMQSLKEKADHFICVSQSTRRDLQRFLNIPQEKISVVYQGVDHKVFYSLSQDQRAEAKAHLEDLGIKGPYILSVGTIEPRKNLTGLLKSFSQLKANKDFEGKLVVVGMKGWMQESLNNLIQELGLQGQVIFLGFISDSQLRELYNLAEVFVFPSFYEGFGFPIVEAFACGSAVITSSTSSCGEIAGNSAITIDPQGITSMTEALVKVLKDEHLRVDLRRRSIERAQEFSFLKTAEETLNIYKSRIGGV